MESNKRTSWMILPLLLALLHVCTLGKTQNCPSRPDGILTDLSCFSDFNQIITCEWNSMFAPDHVCTLHAERIVPPDEILTYSSSCNMKPVDVSKPRLRNCTMNFKYNFMFMESDVLSMNLICDPMKKIPVMSISYKPACHIKLDPPQKPEINFTTVSWSPTGDRQHPVLRLFRFELQWKHEDQSWKDASKQPKQKHEKQCKWECTTHLKTNWLNRGEKYQARVRVKAIAEDTQSVWSDWSPTESWVSPVGEIKAVSDGPELTSGVVVCSVVITLLLAVIYLKRNKTVWIYMTTKIKGQPIPNPSKSFLKDFDFQTSLHPEFTTFLMAPGTASVEITSRVDAVSPCKLELAQLEEMKIKSSYDSTSSSFSNPSYAHLCSSPPLHLPLPTVGNLDPCAADTPYGPVCCKSQAEETEEEMEELRRKDREILELLSKGSTEKKSVVMISGYERAEKLQAERLRLQSLDSGVCSGEEVSQESLEPDSMTQSIDEEREETGVEKEEGVFQRLFGGLGNVSGKGCMQVCSGYEPVQKLQPDTAEGSIRSCRDEEQFSSKESLEDDDKSTESTNFLSHPPCSLSLNLTGPALSPALPPLMEKMALMSTSRSVMPSGDGYMPVTVEQG